MSENTAAVLSFPTRQSFTPAQRELWDLMSDLVRKFPPKDVLDALSDAFLFESDETTGQESKRLFDIGRALERVTAEVAP